MGKRQWHALPVLRQLDDGVEITAEAGLGSVRLRCAGRPWDDEVLDLRCELADDGVNALARVRTLNGDGILSWAAELAESYAGWDDVRAWESLASALR
ncbi:DUF6228 family protein [Micromonospora sp. NBC_01638]|uniref:DUF6228 family protein n=1 Tax=Micromonospora sp. NBC_01638 TaxID=2975982 RepID=UPI00387003AB